MHYQEAGWYPLFKKFWAKQWNCWNYNTHYGRAQNAFKNWSLQGGAKVS